MHSLVLLLKQLLLAQHHSYKNAEINVLQHMTQQQHKGTHEISMNVCNFFRVRALENHKYRLRTNIHANTHIKASSLQILISFLFSVLHTRKAHSLYPSFPSLSLFISFCMRVRLSFIHGSIHLCIYIHSFSGFDPFSRWPGRSHFSKMKRLFS